MTFGIYLLLNVVLLLFLAIWVRKLIVRRLEPERILDDLSNEIGALVAELNQTGDHNVSILEDRIMQLRDLVADADRQIEELSTIVEQVQARTSSEEPVYTVSFSDSTGGSSNHARGGQPQRAQPPETEDDSVHDVNDPGPLWHDMPTQSAASRENTTEPRHDVLSPREKVHELHQQGLSSEMIAGKTGMAIGEVELIISLGAGRGSK
ncbi:MAG: hypothetical protein ACOCYB_04420 [Alkalispirochaeta sp.]